MLRLRPLPLLPLRLLPLRLQPLAWSGGSSGVRDATNDVRSGAQRATNGVRSGAQVQIQLPAQLQPPAHLSNSTGSAKSLAGGGLIGELMRPRKCHGAYQPRSPEERFAPVHPSSQNSHRVSHASSSHRIAQALRQYSDWSRLLRSQSGGFRCGIEWRCLPWLEPERADQLAVQVQVFPALGQCLISDDERQIARASVSRQSARARRSISLP